MVNEDDLNANDVDPTDEPNGETKELWKGEHIGENFSDFESMDQNTSQLEKEKTVGTEVENSEDSSGDSVVLNIDKFLGSDGVTGLRGKEFSGPISVTVNNSDYTDFQMLGDLEMKIPNSLVELPQTDIIQLSRQLMESRVLVVYSEDEDFINNAIIRIIRFVESTLKGKKSAYKLKYWEEDRTDKLKKKPSDSSDGESSSNEFSSSDSNQNTFENHSISQFRSMKFSAEKAETTFIKVDLTNRSFLRSLCFNSQESYASLQKEFVDKGIYIICRLDRKLMRTLEEESTDPTVNKILQNRYPFHFAKVPFLNAYLNRHFSEADKINVVINQMNQGLWGKGATEDTLHDFIVNQFDGNPKRFLEEIEKRQSPEYEENIKELVENLPFDKEPHRTVLYAHVFFSRLNLSEFNSILQVLFEGRATSRSRKIDKLSQRQGVVSLKETYEVPLIQLWEAEMDQILAECKIGAVPAKDGHVQLKFREVGLEDQIKDFMVRNLSFYMIERYESIRGSFNLFSPNVSEVLFEEFSILTATMSSYNTSRYIGEYLIYYYRIIIGKEEENEEFDGIDKVVAEIRNRLERWLGLHRIIQLMSELLNKEAFVKNEVLNFLDRIVLFEKYDDLMVILQELSSNDHFDQIEWLFKIVDENPNEDVEKELKAFLSRQLEEWGTDSFKHLMSIRNKMFDKNQKDNSDLSNSQQFILSLVFYLGNPINQRIPVKSYGKWPVEFEFLAPLNYLDDPAEYFEFIIDWLFDKQIDQLFQRDERDELIKARTIVLESWILVLEGIAASEITETGNQLRTDLLHTVCTRVERKSLKEIKSQCTRNTLDYNETIVDQIGEKNKFYLNLYKAKKRALLELKKAIVHQLNN